MNWDDVKGRWKEMRGQAKTTWGKLTDDDLQQVEGKRDQLVGAIQRRYGYAKEQAEKSIDDWLHEMKPSQPEPQKTL